MVDRLHYIKLLYSSLSQQLVKYMFDMMKADYTAAIHLEYCIRVIIYGRMWDNSFFIKTKKGGAWAISNNPMKTLTWR